MVTHSVIVLVNRALLRGRDENRCLLKFWCKPYSMQPTSVGVHLNRKCIADIQMLQVPKYLTSLFRICVILFMKYSSQA